MIYEVGFDKWQWIPRRDLIGLVGVWLALPWTVKALTGGARRFHAFLGSTVVIMLQIVAGLTFYDPYPQSGQLTSERQSQVTQGAAQDWSAYGGTAAGQRFSQLEQINKNNVNQLEVAWTYHTGDLRNSDKDASEYTFEATPLKSQ